MKIFSAKFPSEKEVLAPVIEKYIAVMRSFWGKFCVEPRLQYYKLDGDVCSIHFRLEIPFLRKFCPKNQWYLA